MKARPAQKANALQLSAIAHHEQEPTSEDSYFLNLLQYLNNPINGTCKKPEENIRLPLYLLEIFSFTNHRLMNKIVHRNTHTPLTIFLILIKPI